MKEVYAQPSEAVEKLAATARLCGSYLPVSGGGAAYRRGTRQPAGDGVGR